jgi:hypothetical protein
MLRRSFAPVLAIALLSPIGFGVAPLASAAPMSEPLTLGACAPFNNPSNITSVYPYKVKETNLRRWSERLQGAIVNVPAEPGLTREWLQRVVSDSAAASTPGCPMAVPGATARVSSTGGGFAITVQSPNKDSAKEILRRAQTLANLPVTQAP